MAFCQNCGAQLGEGEKFCGSCGSAVVGAASAAPVAPVVPVMPQVMSQQSLFEQQQKVRQDSRMLRKSMPSYCSSLHRAISTLTRLFFR